jgi:DNA-binding CsgD family transcriptional regulator
MLGSEVGYDANQANSRVDVLNSRELIVANLMSEGRTDLEIERILGCAGDLVKRQVRAIILKLEVKSREAAVEKWRRLRVNSS